MLNSSWLNMKKEKELIRLHNRKLQKAWLCRSSDNNEFWFFEASSDLSLTSVAFFLKLYLVTPNSPLGHTMAIAVLSLDHPVYPEKKIFPHINKTPDCNHLQDWRHVFNSWQITSNHLWS